MNEIGRQTDYAFGIIIFCSVNVFRRVRQREKRRNEMKKKDKHVDV